MGIDAFGAIVGLIPILVILLVKFRKAMSTSE